MRAFVSLVLLALAGCSNAGSQTLLVIAEVIASGDSTNVEVSVQLRDSPVIGANVVVKEAETEKTTTLESRSPGIYRSIIAGYARELELSITSGDDDLNAELEGPAPHQITRPPNDAIVRRGDFSVLRVEWAAEEDADLVEVEARGAAAFAVSGNEYEAEVPLASLTDGDQTISVTRERAVDLEGGIAGSRMRTRYKVDNRFTLEP
jgi:hypothetical protein